jgi:HEAT repeat protein
VGADGDVSRRRRAVAVAGHSGDRVTALAARHDDDPSVRSMALGALERLGELDDATLRTALEDDSVEVRRRAAELAATHPSVDLVPTLHDDDPRVVEVAAWACGEHESNDDDVLERLTELAQTAGDPLVRESAVAALGAIGDPRGFGAIEHGTSDKPAIRRRAVLALAPFLDDDELGDRVTAILARTLADRDWQVRQSAEDLQRVLDA